MWTTGSSDKNRSTEQIEPRHLRSNSLSSDWSDDSTLHPSSNKPHDGDLPPPVLVYHASARSIVFRDQLRRVASQQHLGHEHDGSIDTSESAKRGLALPDVTDHNPSSSPATGIPSYAHETASHDFGILIPHAETLVAGYIAETEPLKPLELGPHDDFLPLLQQSVDDHEMSLTVAEREVLNMLQDQQAVVKTVQNEDWTTLIRRFMQSRSSSYGLHMAHVDKAADATHPFNSFITSTTLLPRGGRKMRCYGSTTMYTVGLIFALPSFSSAEEEDVEVERTLTWAWPAGYSAKTEFNRDSRGLLINGRQEAILPLSVLRQYNNDYLSKKEYMVGLRMVSGLTAIPYNEVFLRVGGLGRIVCGKDVVTGQECNRSLENGVGLPVALFVRTAHFGHLITMLRTRARLLHLWGEEHVKSIPLLYVSPDEGVKVLTEALQQELWKAAARNLNPFQNSHIAFKTTIDNTDEASFQQKVEELLELDESIRSILTPEELARLAGGFGATDYSVATILKKVMENERQEKQAHGDAGESHRLQDVVNEGMAAAVRSGDYHTSRQLLILYSLVASSRNDATSNIEPGAAAVRDEDGDAGDHAGPRLVRSSSLGRDPVAMKKELEHAIKNKDGSMLDLPSPPPPPPLDTDRLRSATNSDGLLAVLGAAQVLRAMQDGSAQKRAFEAVAAVEEWVDYGQQSMAFRISSWYDQKSAQGDLQIASENPSNFMAFVSNKAITNRKSFAEQLRQAVSNTDFNSFRFLKAIDTMLAKMHSPCLRLELLQYILGLDNRFSVAHVRRSVELAATCLGISQGSCILSDD